MSLEETQEWTEVDHLSFSLDAASFHCGNEDPI